MISAWTKHCKSDDEKQQYLESLRRVSWVMEDLRKLVNESVDSIELQETSPKSYDSPNWAYRQAHANGYKQAMRDFMKLTILDPKEDNGRQPTQSG
jgi:hypothetical protein